MACVQSPVMDSIPIVISGSGNMGRQVALAAAADPATEPLAFIDALGEGDSCEGLPLYREAAPALDAHQPQVVVDFSNAAWTPVLARAALERGVRLVIGTTGLPAAFLDELREEASSRKLGVVVAPNFAIGAVLLMYFARQAARFFDYAEIIELHHAGKVDAPSGTAKTTAEQMVEARGEPFQRVEAEVQTVPAPAAASLAASPFTPCACPASSPTRRCSSAASARRSACATTAPGAIPSCPACSRP